MDAPAKINLALRVGPPRSDGFHPVAMVMQAVSLADRLFLELAAEDRLTVEGAHPVPVAGNLALRALGAYRRQGVHASIRLVKQIPVAAGLGGGSSDAAGVLRLLAAAEATRDADVRSVAASIGSDVPFFLGRPCMLAEGRGELLTPVVGLPPTVPILLLNPGVPVSTARAYGWVSSRAQADAPASLLAALARRDVAEVGELLENDLETPVVARHPVIGEMRELLKREGALGTAMSGSGSTVFGLFADRDRAVWAQGRLARLVPFCALVHPLEDFPTPERSVPEAEEWKRSVR